MYLNRTSHIILHPILTEFLQKRFYVKGKYALALTLSLTPCVERRADSSALLRSQPTGL